MRCNTPLCGHQAQFVNAKTKEYKCAVCRDKRLDKDSIVWRELTFDEMEDSVPYMTPIPKVEPRNIYSVEKIGGTSNETYGIAAQGKQEYVLVLRDEGVATTVCAALNKAYKKGVTEVLHGLNTFSLDKRREHGILWGDGNTGQNRNY